MKTMAEVREIPMFESVIALLNGDRPLFTDKALFAAAIAIREEYPLLDRVEALVVDGMLAWAVHRAGNLPTIARKARDMAQGPFSMRHYLTANVGETAEDMCMAIHAKIALFREARTASEDGTAYIRCEELLTKMKDRYPEIGLSFGYIGNLSIANDDRQWKYFTNVRAATTSTSSNNSFGRHTTAYLGKLMQKAEAELDGWCEDLANGLKEGRFCKIQ